MLVYLGRIGGSRHLLALPIPERLPLVGVTRWVRARFVWQVANYVIAQAGSVEMQDDVSYGSVEPIGLHNTGLSVTLRSGALERVCA